MAAGLLTSDGDDAILEVAHEALFQSWSRRSMQSRHPPTSFAGAPT